MLKKLPIKNIIIVVAAMLVIPVMAFAMVTNTDGNREAANNDNIKITAGEGSPDAASAATSVLTSGALGYLDAATSATGTNPTGQGNGVTDAVSSATSNPGTTGSIQGDDDDQYESDDDDEEDEEDDD